MCRDQDILLEEATRRTNRLTACLKEYYPVALELFSRLILPVTLEFLQTYPILEAVRNKASVPELAPFLKAHRHLQPNLTGQALF